MKRERFIEVEIEFRLIFYG